ncbi:MAG TPA: hypothetical protein VK935_13525, partial [Actinomycetospora sp.]|nr:hypothetical protein [Actinomycetospora sp.]
GVPTAARDSLAAAQALGDPGVLVPAREAFSGSVEVVAGAAALLLVGVATLAVATLRHVPRTGDAVDEPVPVAA